MHDITCLVDKHRGPEPYFRFKREDRNKLPRHFHPTRVVNDVRQRTHNRARTDGCLNRVYPDAIEIYCPVALAKWQPIIITVFFMGLSAMVFYMTFEFYNLLGPLNFPVILFALTSVVGLLATWMMYRIAMWGPADRPLLFNRKTREVTVFHVGLPHFFKVWQAPQTRLTTCPWDSIKVRTYRYRTVSTNMYIVRRDMALVWGEPHDPRQFKDFAKIGTQTNWRDDVLFPLWEHVRRYMEEDGPPVPPGGALGPGYDLPCPFPPEVIAAAGGAPYSRDQVWRMAHPGADESADAKASDGWESNSPSPSSAVPRAPGSRR